MRWVSERKASKNIFINIMVINGLMLLPTEYFHYPPSFQPKNFTFAALDMRRERKPKCAPQLFLETLLGTRRSAIKVMLHGTICNIVATLF